MRPCVGQPRTHDRSSRPLQPTPFPTHGSRSREVMRRSRPGRELGRCALLDAKEGEASRIRLEAQRLGNGGRIRPVRGVERLQRRAVGGIEGREPRREHPACRRRRHFRLGGGDGPTAQDEREDSYHHAPFDTPEEIEGSSPRGLRFALGTDMGGGFSPEHDSTPAHYGWNSVEGRGPLQIFLNRLILKLLCRMNCYQRWLEKGTSPHECAIISTYCCYYGQECHYCW